MILIMLLILAGCRSDMHNSVVGEWAGQDPNGVRQSFIFNHDDSALWIFQLPAAQDTFKIHYNADYTRLPHTIDLFGFDHGHLKDKTLYGIFEFIGKTSLRMDCRPGPAAENNDHARPQSFSLQSIVYRKVK